MPRLHVRPAAGDDVVAAFEWYEAHRAGLGSQFADEISRTYAAIEAAPLRFPVVLDDIRMAMVRRFPYLVYFALLDDAVSVIAVLHGHRSPVAWRQRR